MPPFHTGCRIIPPPRDANRPWLFPRLHKASLIAIIHHPHFHIGRSQKEIVNPFWISHHHFCHQLTKSNWIFGHKGQSFAVVCVRWCISWGWYIPNPWMVDFGPYLVDVWQGVWHPCVSVGANLTKACVVLCWVWIMSVEYKYGLLKISVRDSVLNAVCMVFKKCCVSRQSRKGRSIYSG